jgi:hypothetical protein
MEVMKYCLWTCDVWRAHVGAIQLMTAQLTNTTHAYAVYSLELEQGISKRDNPTTYVTHSAESMFIIG